MPCLGFPWRVAETGNGLSLDLPMFDTIKLKFIYPHPNNSFFAEKLWGKDVWTNNPWRKEQQKLGLYVPKYSIESDFKYPSKTYFYIEFSAPKMITGGNLIEIKESQLEELVYAISRFCQKIGVFIFPAQIKACLPSLVAIGININLTPICSVNNALKVLSPFDYKTHTKHRVIGFDDYKHGGREVILSTKNETLKAYGKNQEMLNSAETQKELAIADLLRKGEFRMDGQLAKEILRIEATFKTPRKIKEKFKPYLGVLPPTLENIFKQNIWEQVLREQVDEVFNHPLQKIIFLSLEKQPIIDDFLDKHYNHIQTKATIRQIIGELQENGLAETRKQYLKTYKSRQTWYNYLARLAELQNHFDWRELGKLDNVKIHKYILEQFGIISTIQQELGLNFASPVSKIIDANQRNPVSKIIDANQRNTRGAYD